MEQERKRGREHEFKWGPMERDDSHEAGCSCGAKLGSFDYEEDARVAWQGHVLLKTGVL